MRVIRATWPEVNTSARGRFGIVEFNKVYYKVNRVESPRLPLVVAMCFNKPFEAYLMAAGMVVYGAGAAPERPLYFQQTHIIDQFLLPSQLAPSRGCSRE